MPDTDIQVVRQEETPMSIIERAVEMKADPEQVEKWMILQERFEKNQAGKAFAAAMHACQQQMPRVVRDAVNEQTRSKYARLETVQDTCRKVYTDHGFSLNYGEDDCPTPEYKRTVCDVRHIGGVCHRYHLDLPIDGIGPKGNVIGGMNKVQGCISTTSYGQRRLLCMIFNITIADEDNDAQGLVTITPEQAIQLKEIAEGVDADTIHAGFKWIKSMTGSDIQAFDEVPAVAFDMFRAKLVEKADDKRKSGEA